MYFHDYIHEYMYCTCMCTCIVPFVVLPPAMFLPHLPGRSAVPGGGVGGREVCALIGIIHLLAGERVFTCIILL